MIKYIATVKTYRDRINGNTYWSANVEDVENDRNLIFPFTYGSAYEIEAQQVIKRALNIKDKLGENSIIRFTRIENCSEEEVSQHGYYDENMLMHCSEGGRYYLQD
mgnify:FL=1